MNRGRDKEVKDIEKSFLKSVEKIRDIPHPERTRNERDAKGDLNEK